MHHHILRVCPLLLFVLQINQHHKSGRPFMYRWLVSQCPCYSLEKSTAKNYSLLEDKKTLIMQFLLCRRISEYKRLIKPFLKLQQFSIFFLPLGWTGRVLLSLLHMKLRYGCTEAVYQRGERLRNRGFASYTVLQANILAQNICNSQSVHTDMWHTDWKPLGVDLAIKPVTTHLLTGS